MRSQFGDLRSVAAARRVVRSVPPSTNLLDDFPRLLQSMGIVMDFNWSELVSELTADVAAREQVATIVVLNDEDRWTEKLPPCGGAEGGIDLV
jgi:hypothetical protein